MSEEKRNWQFPTIALALLVGGLILLGGLLDENFTADGLWKQALDLQKDNKCKQAIEKFDGVIRRRPKMVDAYFQRGLCHHREGNYRNAGRDYEQVLQLKPDFVAAHYNLGLVHLYLEDIDQALLAFESAIRLDPKKPDAHRQRGDILRDRGELAEALAEYTTLAGLSANVVNIQRRLLLLREMGEFDRAIAEYERMGGTADQYPFALYERAAVLREKGEIDTALAELNALVQRRPDLAGGYIERGLIALMTPGQAAAAAQDFATALAVGNRYREQAWIQDAVSKQLGQPTTGPVISPHVPFTPAAHYLIVRLHVARKIAGEDDAAEYAANIKTVVQATTPLAIFFDERFSSWPGPIINLFRGRATPEDVRNAVRSTKAAHPRQRRECEANFYLAEYHLEKGDKDSALPLLAAAAAGCPLTAPERNLAKAELKRVGS